MMLATLAGLPAIAAWGPAGWADWLPSGCQRWRAQLQEIIVIPSSEQAHPQPPEVTVGPVPKLLTEPRSQSVSQRLPELPAEAAELPGQEQTMATLRQSLESLGAVSYRLTTWGTSGELFRCVSRVPVGDNRLLCRQFEATGSDPLQTMQQLIDQVTSWQRTTQSHN